ncbi:hypothetical protein NDU88_004654 [Pleurodeles waltl]|uniref:Uncharacterized protein n=1 Tax=Pleurodeles waltl TaxID=8319 RepID=A0AAV7TSK7_PLEWA|nr:hypothetical protein NDU88_004654 [Pleurodeles waltl]
MTPPPWRRPLLGCGTPSTLLQCSCRFDQQKHCNRAFLHVRPAGTVLRAKCYPTAQSWLTSTLGMRTVCKAVRVNSESASQGGPCPAIQGSAGAPLQLPALVLHKPFHGGEPAMKRLAENKIVISHVALSSAPPWLSTTKTTITLSGSLILAETAVFRRVARQSCHVVVGPSQLQLSDLIREAGSLRTTILVMRPLILFWVWFLVTKTHLLAKLIYELHEGSSSLILIRLF